jgi:hypothetical protein
MVRKFVFIPGAEPRLSPREAGHVPSLGRLSGAVGVRHEGPPRMAMQWLLLGLALAVSAAAFSAAKAASDRQAGQTTAAADR